VGLGDSFALTSTEPVTMTTHHTHTNNLLFLLAAAPMGMGCIIVTDDGDDATGAGTSTNQTTGSQTSDGTATDTGMATGQATGTSDPTEGSDTAVVDSTATEGEDTTGGSGSNVCADYAALFEECRLSYGEYAEMYCNYTLAYLEEYSAECAMAYADFIGCLSALSCEEFEVGGRCGPALDAFLKLGCPSAE
jgi:hypothetical protein